MSEPTSICEHGEWVPRCHLCIGREKDATIAAMREALLAEQVMPGGFTDEAELIRCRQRADDLRYKALASDAGRALLAELERLRKEHSDCVERGAYQSLMSMKQGAVSGLNAARAELLALRADAERLRVEALDYLFKFKNADARRAEFLAERDAVQAQHEGSQRALTKALGELTEARADAERLRGERDEAKRILEKQIAAHAIASSERAEARGERDCREAERNHWRDLVMSERASAAALRSRVKTLEGALRNVRVNLFTEGMFDEPALSEWVSSHNATIDAALSEEPKR